MLVAIKRKNKDESSIGAATRYQCIGGMKKREEFPTNMRQGIHFLVRIVFENFLPIFVHDENS